MTVTFPQRLLAAARAEQARMVALRRRLHAAPEIGLQLPRTQQAVLAELADLPVAVHVGRALTSVVAVLSGARPGPVVMLRADMDALPLPETAEVDYRSTEPGAMHACGHDLHTAMLAGAARVLSAHRDELGGTVVFVFQPGEEGHHGMVRMLEEGLLTVAGRPADATYGLHVMAGSVAPGLFTTRPGATHAAANDFTVTVQGRGGHGGFPHEAQDPVPVAAEIVLALQAMVTRRFNAHDPVVVTVGLVQAGTVSNAIPATAEMRGSARAFSPATAARLPEAMRALVGGVAQAHGLTADLTFGRQFPPVMNDAAEVDRARATVGELFGDDRFAELAHPVPAGDDYAHLLQAVPGAFVMLGAGHPGATVGNHNSGVVFDDAVLADGAAFLAAVATRRLAAG